MHVMLKKFLHLFFFQYTSKLKDFQRPNFWNMIENMSELGAPTVYWLMGSPRVKDSAERARFEIGHLRRAHIQWLYKWDIYVNN